MAFVFDYSDEFKDTLEKISKKHKLLYEAVMKKMNEIVLRDHQTIDYYKNLRGDLKEFKRVHVLKHYVLFFRVYKEKNLIYFQKLRHHDEAYE